ncbi:extracellular solute-binding protein [Bariatricus massiliensis]|uniref:Extracellular solute-binding protein n=1 Tax=Bariatricus massiliensis TaxID=1745713 RepID=A0ABS8DHC2_9FIRM|nr:extracellular solute-binding protein [Bariatricus massiliensis]MCB7304777.1 extracellular solute-binding protein [Bariatricus massiliensis]MCB7375331.1 extracellular solute-binding protein [Bariatricus massiliensis]MCB7387791.1 extracellular solute-binding protein [Bariatricus massiliensis]MCB7412120.1 extracellular solute-binding protein [Bariatricus massiliensis]MCQ5254499.1 extracellular solute-binding protein [Bariatricus massiliensis]
MKNWKRAAAAAMIMTLTAAGCGSGAGTKKEKETALDPEKPVTITVWNYYTGAQQTAFDGLVEEFNQSRGKDLGITVKASNEGGITDLEENVLAAAEKKVGAKEVPNIFAAYTDTAYNVDKMGIVADLSEYFTEKEKEEYIDSYITEGSFPDGESLKILPVAKATEVFMLNKTDWDKFASATGAELSDLETIEGLTETAEKYYEWTDSLTEEPDDGKAFFGRDAMANYMIIGAMQLGTQIIEGDGTGKVKINFPEEIARKLWDNYYIPFINGHFSAAGRFRSDDIKTGNIISFVGSSSGATFFPDKVILNDDESYSIETEILPAPQFKEGEGYAVQQGAGMVVTKGSEAEIEASVEFLKWFTDTKQNTYFSAASGYLPVKKVANDAEAMQKETDGNETVGKVIEVSIETVNNNHLYTTPAYDNGTTARNVLEYSMSDKAAEDRQAIEADIAAGTPRGDAIAKYDTDENFKAWYQSTKEKLEQTVK